MSKVVKEHLLAKGLDWILTLDIRDDGKLELCHADLVEQMDTVIPLPRDAMVRLLSKLNELVPAIERLAHLDPDDTEPSDAMLG